MVVWLVLHDICLFCNHPVWISQFWIMIIEIQLVWSVKWARHSILAGNWTALRSYWVGQSWWPVEIWKSGWIRLNNSGPSTHLLDSVLRLKSCFNTISICQSFAVYYHGVTSTVFSHSNSVCICSVGYILNVTREIDNFFPGIFEYCNVRLYDLEDSDLLKHWPRTFDFISKARLVSSFC